MQFIGWILDKYSGLIIISAPNVHLKGGVSLPISNSSDVYLSLVERDEDTSWLHGLVAFAVFEERRIEWMRHSEKQNGKVPTVSEIRRWYEQQPDGSLLRAKGDAENALQLFAEDVEKSILADARKSLENEVIVSEIRSIKRPWADFGVNVAAGFLSALLFAAVLTILAFVVFADISPVNVGKYLGDEEKEMMENGKKTDK